MADYLIPYIEFLGLPGSGKSYYSHKVAEKLRGEGYKIAEPSWDLDHSTGKYARAFKKMMMAWLFTMCHRHKAAGIKAVIRNCGLSHTEEIRFYRNVLYKAYLLTKRNNDILFFDEGMAQMAVSLSVKTDKPVEQIYNELLTRLSQKQNALLIRIDCNVETALLNMNKRDSHDSYVERLDNLEEKNYYLGRYKTECESIILKNALVVPYSQNDSMVVTTIAEFIKAQLNNDIINMMENKIIALLTNNDDDVYCFRKELIEALIADGYEMLISCPDGPKFELMKDIPYIYDNPDIDRRGTNPVKDLCLMSHYWKLFRKYRPAVVLTYTAKPNVYASIAAHQLGIPVINNLTGLGSVVNETGLMKSFIMWLFRQAYRKTACMMFQNETNMKVAIDQGMVKGKYRLIPGSGVDTDRYPLQPYPNGGDGKVGEPVVFNYIGRILHDKGVDDYIEAAKRIKEKYPQTEFNLMGFIEPTEIHYEKDLKELQEQGIVIYRGSQKDVKPFIARAHCTIHPSTYGEGMSNVLLESASSGRFLITTNNPGCQETVENEKTGYIYQGGNADALVSTIERFLALPNNERKVAGELGRKRMEEKFSRKIVIKAYREEIKRILDSQR